MTKIFKQLARHWAVCLVVFALLFVQAYCDLSLPDYTSKIVDTGIQQGGIESPLPDTVRQSTLDALSLLMREEDAAAFQNAYTADGDVLRLRTDLTADERTALEDAVTTPDIVLYLAAAQAANTPAGQTGMGMTGLADLQASGADRNPDTETETAAPTAEDLDTVCGQFAAMSQMPGFRRDAVQQQLTSAIGQLDDTVVENLKSQALLLVGLEYEAQGIAHAVQMHYLYKVGGQMLALTLLMAIGATLLALPGGIALAGLAWRYGGLTRRLLFLWAEIIRGIPLIFVIFWLWYLLPMLTGGDLPGAVTVTLALAWFTAASVMHSVLAGLQSLPKGQYEAALTQGFAPGQTLRLVLLPQALRNVQPSLVGIFIGLLKDTSLAFIVNVPELTTVAGQVNNRVQIYPLAIFVFTGAVYYLLCCGLSLLASRRFTRRATAG